MRWLYLCLVFSFTWLTEAAVSLKIDTNRDTALYDVGDEVTFTISAYDGKKKLDWGEVNWSLSMDGYKVLSRGKGSLEGGVPVTVKGNLDRPGFLLLSATFTGPDSKKVTAWGSAGISPEQIKPSMSVPEDFDQFWSEQKADLAKVPVTFETTPAVSPTKLAEVWDIQIQAEKNGKPVSGYYAKPVGAKPGSCPAVLWVHGAGVRSSSLTAAVNGAKDGFISMDINAHGIPNGKPKEYYTDLANGELKNYRNAGNTSRDSVYFRGMFLRLVRAIDFLTTRPEWNGEVMAVVGHSQGGFQAIVAGGLDDRVTFIGAGVPAGCDHTGTKADRISGWPKIVPVDTEKGPLPAAITASRYVDAVNFATRFQGESIFSVGYIDRVCPPTSIFAAYNALQGKKQMVHRPKMGHSGPADIKSEFREALLRHAEKRTTVVYQVHSETVPGTVAWHGDKAKRSGIREDFPVNLRNENSLRRIPPVHWPPGFGFGFSCLEAKLKKSSRIPLPTSTLCISLTVAAAH